MVRAIQQPHTLPPIPVRHKPPQAPPVPGSKQVSLPPIPEPPKPRVHQQVETQPTGNQNARDAYRKQTSPSSKMERRQAVSSFRQAVKESKLTGTSCSTPKELLEKFEQLMKLLG